MTADRDEVRRAIHPRIRDGLGIMFPLAGDLTDRVLGELERMGLVLPELPDSAEDFRDIDHGVFADCSGCEHSLFLYFDAEDGWTWSHTGGTPPQDHEADPL